jgi:hypothetical protein
MNGRPTHYRRVQRDNTPMRTWPAAFLPLAGNGVPQTMSAEISPAEIPYASKLIHHSRRLNSPFLTDCYRKLDAITPPLCRKSGVDAWQVSQLKMNKPMLRPDRRSETIRP